MFYQDYYWKKGFPIGTLKLKQPLDDPCFKLVCDPYLKRVTLEFYQNSLYNYTIYDSIILDFRKLSEAEQTGWQKETVMQEKESKTVLIRDMDDRVIFIEKHDIKNKTCFIYSPHNWLTSFHRLYYESQGDSFNGVILFDPFKKPVMVKKYSVEGDEFTQLNTEEWDMSLWPKLNLQIKNSQ